MSSIQHVSKQRVELEGSTENLYLAGTNVKSVEGYSFCLGVNVGLGGAAAAVARD